jgi:DNA-binding response OmpR family regulator
MVSSAPSTMDHDQDRATRRRVLVVEDEPHLSQLVTDILEAEGYAVHAVGTGQEAEAVLERVKPDLVLLDIMLPDSDGLILCSQFQARWPAPVIMVSATKRERDRVLSLRLGADDFIAKPFDTLELVARVEAVLRRATGGRPIEPAQSWTNAIGTFAKAAEPRGPEAQQPPNGGKEHIVYRVGALAIDLRRRAVTIDGQPVHLTPTEHRLLTTLASEPERVFSRDELAEVIWGYDSLGESRAVDVHIRRLRAKLEPFGDKAPPIETVRGFGYKLAEDRNGAASA